MSAEDAMREIWGLLCPDCGPGDNDAIVAHVRHNAVEDAWQLRQRERGRCADAIEKAADGYAVGDQYGAGLYGAASIVRELE